MKGLEEGSGTQSSLVWECFKIIEYHKPKYLLMENVKNLVSNKFKSYFDMICNKLEELGYNNYWKVLNGKDFDVPQNRERVMMVSIRKDIDKGNFEMPIGIPTTKCLKDVLDNDVEDKYYVQKQMVNKFIPNENFKNPYNTDKQKPTELGFIQKGESGTKHQSNTVYDGDCVSCTLCAGDWKSPKMFMIEGKETKIITHNIYQEVNVVQNMVIRKLTPKECWRLMGFTDEDFYKAQTIGLSNTKLYERAGRGIVVPMLEEIFRNLFLK